MSWFRKAAVAEPQAAKSGTIRCAVERASVCMADDVLAPNAATYKIEVAPDDPNPALACIEAIVGHHDYLPSVGGGSTWIVYADKRPIALATKADRGREIIPLPVVPAFEPPPSRLAIRFDYYLNNDPQRIMRQLLAGERVNRIYEDMSAR